MTERQATGLYEDPELGWGGLAREVLTFGIPGADDNNRQAVIEPGASFVAARIGAYLDGATARTAMYGPLG